MRYVRRPTFAGDNLMFSNRGVQTAVLTSVLALSSGDKEHLRGASSFALVVPVGRLRTTSTWCAIASLRHPQIPANVIVSLAIWHFVAERLDIQRGGAGGDEYTVASAPSNAPLRVLAPCCYRLPQCPPRLQIAVCVLDIDLRTVCLNERCTCERYVRRYTHTQ